MGTGTDKFQILWFAGLTMGMSLIAIWKGGQIAWRRQLDNPLVELRGGRALAPWLARRVVAQLLAYSAAHFDGEELLMEAAAFPEREAHAREHQEFLAHIRQVERALDEGDEAVALEAALDLRVALAAHMNDADRRLAAAARAARPAPRG